jgi:hypothetical protein
MDELKKEVKRIVKDNTEGMNKKERETWLRDLSEHGCISGMVSRLIYYSETSAFTNAHREAIMEMLGDDLNDGIISNEQISKEMKAGTFDNFLAWYAFEKIALENFNY